MQQAVKFHTTVMMYVPGLEESRHPLKTRVAIEGTRDDKVILLNSYVLIIMYVGSNRLFTLSFNNMYQMF